MLKVVFVRLLLAVVLIATALPAVAVTLPWTEDEAPRSGHLAIILEVEAASQMLSAASAASFEGLRAARPNAGQTLLAALIRAAVKQAPWLAEAEAKGLWTWNRNPALGVAIYGPGVGGYNSFSWTRAKSTPPNAVASARSRLIVQQVAMPKKALPKGGPGGGGGGGSPTPVPLPAAAPLLLGGVALMGAVARHRKRARA